MNWQPIETAPKTGARILTVRGNGYVAVQRWYSPNLGAHMWLDDVGRVPAGEPTHWMPLPEAP
jgi:hypothetical protein